MSLRLEPLEDLFEAVQARLAHPKQRVGPLDLAEVGRSVAARGVQDVCLAVDILHHEVLPLQSNTTVIPPDLIVPTASTLTHVNICKFYRANMSTLKWLHRYLRVITTWILKCILISSVFMSLDIFHSTNPLLASCVLCLLGFFCQINKSDTVHLLCCINRHLCSAASTYCGFTELNVPKLLKRAAEFPLSSIK